ncbi:hypothetical protein N0V94_001655 [Neodidymelliopsis sp. IMI 364377]|nr:hypothetical protein N0V94_001655 [Neodidymelliopsis sp. IMI 364377]
MYAEQGPAGAVDMDDAGEWPYRIDTAFACLSVDNSEFSQSYPDVLMAGAPGNDGLLCKVGAWPTEYSYATQYPTMNQFTYVESIPNWSPVTGLCVTQLPGIRSPYERERSALFVCNGAAPHGQLSELRYGLQALIDGSFSGMNGCSGLWIIHHGSQTVEFDGRRARQHYALIIVTLPLETILLRLVRTQPETRGEFSGAWDDGVWDVTQLPTESEPNDDGITRNEETISACMFSDHFSIQITRRDVQTLSRPTLALNDRIEFGSSILLAASKPGFSFVVTTFRNDGKTHLNITPILKDGTYDSESPAQDELKAVPRKLITGAKPTQAVYLAAPRKMIVATTKATEEGSSPNKYRLISSTLSLLNVHDDKPLNEVEIKQEVGIELASRLVVARFSLKHAERVYSIVDWAFEDDRGKKYNLVIVGTGIATGPGKETGRRLIFNLGSRGSKLALQKESTYHQPLYCIALFNNRATVSVIGKLLSFDEFDVSSGSDIQQTPTNEQEALVLLTDKRSATVSGLYYSGERSFKHASTTLFEACLPRTVVRLQRGDIRPPWRRSARYHKYANTIDGVLLDDLTGACSDGTIYAFSILSEPARHVLRLLQNLIENKQSRNPANRFSIVRHKSGDIFDVLMNGADGAQDCAIRARDVDPRHKGRGAAASRNNHIDGDLLLGFFDEGGGIKGLLSTDTEEDVLALFVELGEALLFQGRHGLRQAHLTFDDTVAGIQEWMSEVLMPLL